MSGPADEVRFLGDTVAKLGNRWTPKISQELIFRQLRR